MDSQTDDELKYALPLTEHYLKMTPSQIAQKLEKRRLPIEVRLDTLESYRREKPKINKANAKTRQHRRLWREFTMPLKAEIKTVKVMLNNYMGDERHEALSWYLTLLEDVHAYMMKMVDENQHTPATIAKARASILNDGTHWTDWVSMSKREIIYEKFAVIPKGTRTKTPFERRVPKTLGAKLKERLYIRTQKEIEATKRQLKLLRTVNVDFEKIEKLESDLKRMVQALEWIKDLAVGGAVPVTWHGFYKSGAFKTKATSKQEESDDETRT